MSQARGTDGGRATDRKEVRHVVMCTKGMGARYLTKG
jgi:hypothetical protein